MAAAKKKVPATKKANVQVKAKPKPKAVKTPAAKKAKVQVKAKTEVKKKIAKVKVAAKTKPIPKGKTKAKVQVKAKSAVKTKVAAKTKPMPKVKTKAKVQVKAKAKKVGAKPAKKKIVLQKKVVAKKSEKKAIAAKKAVAQKKVLAPVAPAADRFRGLKGMLIAKRDALLKEAKQEIQKYVSGENRQLVDTAIDEADWAAVEISEDLNLKRLSAQRQLLNDVEECLRKVNEGTYGICEDCGEEISEKRLHVIPTASLCIDCKEQREKMAILEQDTEI